MRTIRIGNDIRLSVTLDGIEDYNNTSIKQAKCYLKRVGDDKEKPCCGFPQYISDDYNLNMCGFPAYRVHPSNCTCKCEGFGVFPKSGTNKHRHFDFLMPHKILNEKNKLECYFPADEQRYCGIYELTVVLIMYQYGWGPDNLRTYTVDYGKVFELVDDTSGESGDLTITVNTAYSDQYCTITFIPGFGSGTMNQVRHLQHNRYVLPSCQFTPPLNYTFFKWQVNTNGIQNGLYDPGDIITVHNDVFITATWTDNLKIKETLDKLDKDMDKLRLPEGEQFVKISENQIIQMQ